MIFFYNCHWFKQQCSSPLFLKSFTIVFWICKDIEKTWNIYIGSQLQVKLSIFVSQFCITDLLGTVWLVFYFWQWVCANFRKFQRFQQRHVTEMRMSVLNIHYIERVLRTAEASSGFVSLDDSPWASPTGQFKYWQTPQMKAFQAERHHTINYWHQFMVVFFLWCFPNYGFLCSLNWVRKWSTCYRWL